MPSVSADQAAASNTTCSRSVPRLSTKALALVVASKTNNTVTAGNRRVASKTKKKDDVPALAGNFQDRDEIEIKVSCQNVLSTENSELQQQRKSTKKKEGGTKERHDFSSVCVVYSTVAEDLILTSTNKAGKGEGRDETECLAENVRTDSSLRLPIGCTEIGQVTSSASSFEVSVYTTFSLYKLKDIVVAIYQKVDGNQNGVTTQQQHLLGYSRFGLHRLVRARGETHCNFGNGGQISVLATPTDTKCRNLRFRFAAGKGLGSSKSLGVQTSNKFERNPFLAVSCLHEETDNDDKGAAAKDAIKKGKWEVLWKSDVVRGTSDTQFQFNYGQIPTNRLNGDTPVCITCLDYDDKDKHHTVIGQTRTTYHQLLRAEGFALRHNKMTNGYIGIEHMDMTLVPSLSHYLSRGNLGLDLMVAVDFTKNNMQVDDCDYQDARSFLHRMRRNCKMNSYQLALSSIGRIFEELGSEKSMHIWGFGAEVNGTVKSRFRMGKEGGRVKGVEGLLHAYNQTATSNITMSGPKDLRKTLYTAIARAEMNASTTLSYSVLLILCSEGFVHELNETLEQICEASYTPLSIVFVGIGGGNFSDLRDLVEEQRVSPSGKEFMRDCVSFVQLSQHRHDINKLLKVTLQDLPKQIVQYHMSKQISPDTSIGNSGSTRRNRDSDLSCSSHPHLMAEYECVDMCEVSAYVSPCSSAEETDDGDEGREEEEGTAYLESIAASYESI